jgi:hypothetical protein
MGFNADQDPDPGSQPYADLDPDPNQTLKQCCGSGSGIRCLFDPWIGIRNRFFPDPGSRISDPGSQTHIFESLVKVFWAKNLNNSLKIGPNFFPQHFKNKIRFNFVKFVTPKKRMITNIFSPLSFVAVGSGIRDG